MLFYSSFYKKSTMKVEGTVPSKSKTKPRSAPNKFEGHSVHCCSSVSKVSSTGCSKHSSSRSRNRGKFSSTAKKVPFVLQYLLLIHIMWTDPQQHIIQFPHLTVQRKRLCREHIQPSPIQTSTVVLQRFNQSFFIHTAGSTTDIDKIIIHKDY
jgi:hypothetical protein